MDIVAFVTNLRQTALVQDNYNAYRGMCSRRLATLRKRLGRANSKSKKYAPHPALTPQDLAKDPTHVHLLLYSSERAWAHAMHLKSQQQYSGGSSSMRAHLVSRLHKSHRHAMELAALLSSPESSATQKDVLEANAYASALAGSVAFEKAHWEDALKAFAIARIILFVLLGNTNNEMYRDQLTSTVDPSIVYSAYQLKLPRRMDTMSISRQFFPRGDVKLVSAVESLDAGVFLEPTDAPAAIDSGLVTSVTWRNRTASIQNREISVALAKVQTVENNYYSSESQGSAEAFDAILSAWQDAVDATKKAIDVQIADGVDIREEAMQNLQITWTVVNYSVICWRIGRNRFMIRNIAQGGGGNKKGRDKQEVRGKKLGHWKEEVALYDAILQSLEQISDLPGIAADSEFSSELSAKRTYFSALKCAAIARSHALLSNRLNALSLFHLATAYTASSLSALPSTPSPPSQKGLEVLPSEAKELHKALEGEVARFRALVEIDNIVSKKSNKRSNTQTTTTSSIVAENLETYPEKQIDFVKGIVEWPPRVASVPVEPIFLDIAWNFIEYPGEEGARKVVTSAAGMVESRQEEKEKDAGGKKGFPGSLWGR